METDNCFKSIPFVFKINFRVTYSWYITSTITSRSGWSSSTESSDMYRVQVSSSSPSQPSATLGKLTLFCATSWSVFLCTPGTASSETWCRFLRRHSSYKKVLSTSIPYNLLKITSVFFWDTVSARMNIIFNLDFTISHLRESIRRTPLIMSRDRASVRPTYLYTFISWSVSNSVLWIAMIVSLLRVLSLKSFNFRETSSWHLKVIFFSEYNIFIFMYVMFHNFQQLILDIWRWISILKRVKIHSK